MKRKIAVLLALAVLFTTCTMSAFAANVAVDNNGVEYATLKEAVAGVPDGGTITLKSDIKYDSSNCENDGTWRDGLVYVGDKSFTLDLVGHNIYDEGDLIV